MGALTSLRDLLVQLLRGGSASPAAAPSVNAAADNRELERLRQEASKVDDLEAEVARLKKAARTAGDETEDAEDERDKLKVELRQAREENDKLAREAQDLRYAVQSQEAEIKALKKGQN